MKIAIIGTHGVGKTTLIREVKGIVGDKLLTPPELAREVLDFLNLDWRETPLDQLLFFEGVLFNYTYLVSQQPGPLLADRCPLDVLAYMIYQDPTCKTIPDIVPNAQQAAMRYDHIYFYHVLHPDTAEQQTIQTILERICEVLSVPTIDFTRSDAHRIVEEIAEKYTLAA